MPMNPFENSRIANSTMNSGAQDLVVGRGVPRESSAISRDDQRDGYEAQAAESAISQEPVHSGRTVVPASKVIGNRVRNPAGEDLGTIEEIMVDVRRGSIGYAVLSFGGFLGIGDKLFAVPWTALRIGSAEDDFVLDVDRKLLENAPGFDKGNWPDMADPGFVSAIHDYYGQELTAGTSLTDADDSGTVDNRRR